MLRASRSAGLDGAVKRDDAVKLAEEVLSASRGVTAVVEPLLPVTQAAGLLATIAELRDEEEVGAE
jgi:hypothetical protein